MPILQSATAIAPARVDLVPARASEYTVLIGADVGHLVSQGQNKVNYLIECSLLFSKIQPDCFSVPVGTQSNSVASSRNAREDLTVRSQAN